MFLEEFVEQHRVDLIVTDRVRLSFFVHRYQSRVHLCYLFGNQAKLGRVGLVVLVVERHWLERKDRFTAFVHGVNVFLESLRGSVGTELAADRVNLYVSTERAI